MASIKSNRKTDRFISDAAEKLNYFSGVMLAVMMLTICTDVVLRFFRHPFPGAYEIVGFSGALTIAFALASTSLGKGHIAVEYLVSKFSIKAQKRIERINCFISAIIFGIISWQTVVYSISLKKAGEVSMTLQLPLYPFSWGIAAGCGLVSVVMLFQSFNLVHYGSFGD